MPSSTSRSVSPGDVTMTRRSLRSAINFSRSVVEADAAGRRDARFVAPQQIVHRDRVHRVLGPSPEGSGHRRRVHDVGVASARPAARAARGATRSRTPHGACARRAAAVVALAATPLGRRGRRRRVSGSSKCVKSRRRDRARRSRCRRAGDGCSCSIEIVTVRFTLTSLARPRGRARGRRAPPCPARNRSPANDRRRP